MEPQFNDGAAAEPAPIRTLNATDGNDSAFCNTVAGRISESPLCYTRLVDFDFDFAFFRAYCQQFSYPSKFKNHNAQ